MKPSCRALPGALVLAALAGAAVAQQVTHCDGRASAAAIPEPWSEHTRRFANGDVRLALTDTIDPGAGPVHLLVLSPPRDELGARQCRIVTLNAHLGFAGVDFAALAARYDPATGLAFTLPVQVSEEPGFAARTLRVTLDQATGAIAAGLR